MSAVDAKTAAPKVRSSVKVNKQSGDVDLQAAVSQNAEWKRIVEVTFIFAPFFERAANLINTPSPHHRRQHN
jgi:hypothetical protein